MDQRPLMNYYGTKKDIIIERNITFSKCFHDQSVYKKVGKKNSYRKGLRFVKKYKKKKED